MKSIPLVGAFAIATLGASVGLGPGPLYAQGDAAFRRGIDERNRRPSSQNNAPTDWKFVEKEMRTAILADPTDSGRRVGGSVFGIGGVGTYYLPHFFLGEALFHLGNCADALNEFDESARHLKVRATEQYLNVLRQSSTECERKGYLLWAELIAASRQTEAVIQVAFAADQELRAKAVDNREAWTTRFQQRLRAGQADLDGANAAWQAGRKSRRRADFDEAERLASAAKTAFLATQREFELESVNKKKGLGRALGPILAPAEPEPAGRANAASAISVELSSLGSAERAFSFAESRADLIEQISRYRPLSAAALPKFETGLQAARRTLGEGRRNLGAALASSNLNEAKRIDQVLAQLDAQLDSLEALLNASSINAARIVPEAFKNGASLFFNAQYQQALDALTLALLCQVHSL